MVQLQIKDKLLENIREEKVPNAICFIDKGGRGSLQLASDLGLNIVGFRSNSAIRSNLVHPDLHYIYPTKLPEKKEEKRFNKGMNAYYSDKWREFMSTLILGSFDEWLNFLSSDNKQGIIRVGQISEMISTLNLKPFQSDRKACIIWGLDYLNTEGANKLLKILEEPPKQTYFFLIARDERKVMPTVASRCQIITLPPLESEEGKKDLRTLSAESIEYFKQKEMLFIECLRVCYVSAIKKDFSPLLNKSNELGSLNKSDIKDLFLFGINFMRQTYFYSKGVIRLYEFESLNNFSIGNFSPYVNDKNYKYLISLFELNLYHLSRNANTRMLITSFLLELSNILYSKY
tara:strand:+ start:1054 stop:2091 length:1038 start_codon:yes stop_codon:yes gene_type:complete